MHTCVHQSDQNEGGGEFGNPEITSGGLALKFFASLRLEIRSAGKIKSVSRPYKQAEFDIMFGEGICNLGCILDVAEVAGVIVKKGSWYSFGDIRLGQGRDKVVQFLQENQPICDNIEKLARTRIADEMNSNRDCSPGVPWAPVDIEEAFEEIEKEEEALVEF